jgi:four helix bundle protein
VFDARPDAAVRLARIDGRDVPLSLGMGWQFAQLLPQQIVASASSVAANLAEGHRRTGRDRLHLFRIAAGSADETRAHLRVALAWGWVSEAQVRPALRLLDRQLALIWGLTH